MKVIIQKDWKKILQGYFDSSDFLKLSTFVKREYQRKVIYPPGKYLFYAFDSTPFKQVSVVIVGQDPYHQPKQAMGLSFSVPKGIPLPPSLRNIYKEIENDLGIKKDYINGDLSSWAKQGVLLLNSVLTVEKNKPGSHTNKGWEEFTSFIIKKISEERKNIVFLLWGNYAKKKSLCIKKKDQHLILSSTHPSPFSAQYGFFGNKHFSKCNAYLSAHKKKEIVW